MCFSNKCGVSGYGLNIEVKRINAFFHYMTHTGRASLWTHLRPLRNCRKKVWSDDLNIEGKHINAFFHYMTHTGRASLWTLLRPRTNCRKKVWSDDLKIEGKHINVFFQ